MSEVPLFHSVPVWFSWITMMTLQRRSNCVAFIFTLQRIQSCSNFVAQKLLYYRGASAASFSPQRAGLVLLDSNNHFLKKPLQRALDQRLVSRVGAVQGLLKIEDTHRPRVLQ